MLACGTPAEFIGSSSSAGELRALIKRLASCDCNVLITGETGVGKELAARMIHEKSARAKRSFVAINCAAIPQPLIESELFGHEKGAFTGAHAVRHGKLEAADGGTVLLDEIGEMDLAAQAKLLRVIETRRVERVGGNRTCAFDVRFVAATNQNLEKLIEQNRFRADLFFRLNVIELNVPPLRERDEDIPELVANRLAELNQSNTGRDVRFTDEVLDLFRRHSWPGNVRELRNIVEAAFFLSDCPLIGMGQLPAHLLRRFSETKLLPESEEQRVRAALVSTEWNKTKAARLLHCSRMTLYRNLARYRISA